jgi:hypothetical protein
MVTETTAGAGAQGDRDVVRPTDYPDDRTVAQRQAESRAVGLQRSGLTGELGPRYDPPLLDRVIRRRAGLPDYVQLSPTDKPWVIRALDNGRPAGTIITNMSFTAESVMKGGGAPYPTAGRRTYGPALVRRLAGGTPAAVGIVDTGLPAKTLPEQAREDGWLGGVEGTAEDVDALDALPEPNRFLDLGAGHGTFVAGVVQQVAPSARIRVFKALDSEGVGRETHVAAAIERAAAWGADVIVLSGGTATEQDEPPAPLLDAVRRLASGHGEVLLVAAAGNTGDSDLVWPAALAGVQGLSNVVAVGALTATLKPASWSTRGPWVTCSTIGEGIMSTYVRGVQDPDLVLEPQSFPSDAWALWSGTSFTAPQVAGALARLVQTNACSPRQALADLLSGGGDPDPGYGVPLQILPGTPL